MPEPYKRLLVHCHDMTSTLETFYGSPMRITVLSRELEAVDICARWCSNREEEHRRLSMA